MYGKSVGQRHKPALKPIFWLLSCSSSRTSWSLICTNEYADITSSSMSWPVSRSPSLRHETIICAVDRPVSHETWLPFYEAGVQLHQQTDTVSLGRERWRWRRGGEGREGREGWEGWEGWEGRHKPGVNVCSLTPCGPSVNIYSSHFHLLFTTLSQYLHFIAIKLSPYCIKILKSSFQYEQKQQEQELLRKTVAKLRTRSTRPAFPPLWPLFLYHLDPSIHHRSSFQTSFLEQIDNINRRKTNRSSSI